MAVVFSLDDISRETQEQLAKELTLIPVDPYVEKQKKWGKTVKYQPPVQAVNMYIASAETREIRLPFYSAMKRMGVKPNRDKIFPKLNNKGPPKFAAELRDYQVPVAEECLRNLNDRCTTTLGLPPGWGKTIVGAYLAGKANGVMMVLTHRKKIGQAWVKTFKLCFPQLAKAIWFVGENENEEGIVASKICKNPSENGEACGECKGCNEEDYIIPAIIICMDERIHKVEKRILDSVAVTIVDEAHLFCTPSRVKCLLSTEPKFVIAETATPNRKNGMWCMMESIVGPIGVFRMPDKPHRVYRIFTGISVSTKQGARGLDFTDLTHSLINNEERNRLAINCVKCNRHRKIIIMVRFKDHVPILQNMLTEEGIKVDTLFGSKEEYHDSDVLIGTIPKMGVGFDEANSCEDYKGRPSDLLILMTSIADQDCYEQVKGRVMRSDDPVIFYMEDNMGIVKRHIDSIEDWIRQTKGQVLEVIYEEDSMTIPNYKYVDGVGIEIKEKKKKKIVFKDVEE